MARSSLNVGLLKYNLLMDVVVGISRVEQNLWLKMLNVQLYGMRKSSELWHWNFTTSSHCIIWPFENKVVR